ncbi:hypothetical protein M426DRAFT_323194 [Hypoxylon sp. CI-4A]|nr:hypothetical protein M426DRAFT_323194 [Hypoxylon sp. CI-4A]
MAPRTLHRGCLMSTESNLEQHSSQVANHADQGITLDDENLTIGIIKAMISQHNPLEDLSNIVIHGVREGIDDQEFIHPYVQTKIILWDLKRDIGEHANHQQEPKSLTHSYIMEENEADPNTKQTNFIEPITESQITTKIVVSKNNARGGARQRNIIASSTVLVNFQDL